MSTKVVWTIRYCTLGHTHVCKCGDRSGALSGALVVAHQYGNAEVYRNDTLYRTIVVQD